MQLTGNSQIRFVILAQFGVTFVIALALLFVNEFLAWSALIGGLIAAAINALTALKVFVHYRAQEAGMMLGRMYAAEVQKLLLTGVLFFLAIALVDSLSVGAMLGTYLLIQVAVPLFVVIAEDRLKPGTEKKWLPKP